MMKTNLNYCIVLSSEQLAYLAGSKYGIDRMKILHRLIEEAVLKETEYAINPNRSLETELALFLMTAIRKMRLYIVGS